MQFVEIPIYSISVQLESALRKKEYKEEHIAQAYNILSEKNRRCPLSYSLQLLRSSDLLR